VTDELAAEVATLTELGELVRSRSPLYGRYSEG